MSRQSLTLSIPLEHRRIAKVVDQIPEQEMGQSPTDLVIPEADIRIGLPDRWGHFYHPR